jgi:hypothetical protein
MRNRPVVRIERPNQARDLRQHLVDQLPQLAKLPGVVGITLNGGIARGYADHLSEIDLTLYLESDIFQAWQVQKSPLPLGITVLGGKLYDVKLLDYAAEAAAPWSSDARWDGSYAEILYDPAGLIRQLFAAQLGGQPSIDAIGGFMMSCWWYYRLAGDIWIYRGDVVQGHAMFNQAVVMLAKALFVANLESVPHEKWLFHMSRSLAWTPVDWNRRLEEAMRTGDFNVESLRQRQAAIDLLWNEIDTYARRAYCADIPVTMMQKSFYDLLATLAAAGSMSQAEWEAAGGAGVINMDPFHAVVRIDGETVSLDEARLHAIQADEMYGWHYAVLDAVRGD